MENTTSLVILKGKVPFTNSLVIAEGTKNQHKSVIRLIDTHQEKFNRWGKIYFSDFKSTNYVGDLRGRPTKVAFLNEQQATFLITLLKNTDIVLDFKAELVDQFYKMREVIARQQNAEWLETRKDVKLLFRDMTDTLQLLERYMAEQGSKNGKMVYINYAKLINKTLGIEPKSRDKLPTWILNQISMLQKMIKANVKGLLARGEDYHRIYPKTKVSLENYARIAFIDSPLLN